MDLHREVCLPSGVDWLKLICQPEGGERSVSGVHVSVRMSMSGTNKMLVLIETLILTVLAARRSFVQMSMFSPNISELRRCVKVEVAILGSPSLIILTQLWSLWT